MDIPGLLLCVAFLAPFQGEDEDQALVRYRMAEAAKEQARVALEEAYARTEEALLRWRLAEHEAEVPLPTAVAGLLEGLADVLPADPSSRDPLAAHRARQSSLKVLRAAFQDLLDGRLDAPELNPLLAERLALALRAPEDRVQAEAEARAALEGFLYDERPFHELWNEFLHRRVEEAQAWSDRYNEYLAAGVELDRSRHPEHYIPGGVKVRPGMVFVPGGSYRIGPNTGFERRRRKVTLRPFLIDQFEVTNADYLVFVESLPLEERLDAYPSGWQTGADGVTRPPEDQDSHPVAGVTWHQAAAYASWAGKRLPTEAEWEAACRGRNARLHPWGNEYEKGRCNDNSLGRGATVPVGSHPEGASPFGAQDMAGNVEEWTSSHEEGDVLTHLTSNIVPIVVRGGHYLSNSDNVTGVFRWIAPGGSSREPFLGFRCAADLQ